MSMLKMSAIKMCNLCEDVVELLVSFGLLAGSWFGSTQLINIFMYSSDNIRIYQRPNIIEINGEKLMLSNKLLA